MNNMTPEHKKRRFRELAQHDQRIRTARQLVEQREQPFLQPAGLPRSSEAQILDQGKPVNR
jgi:hypothetical protein